MAKQIDQVQIETSRRETLARDFIAQNKDHLGRRKIGSSASAPVKPKSWVRHAIKNHSANKSLTTYLARDVLAILVAEKQFDHLGDFARMLAPQISPFLGVDKPVFLFALDKNVSTMNPVKPGDAEWASGVYFRNALPLSEAVALARIEAKSSSEITENDKDRLISVFEKLEKSLGFINFRHRSFSNKHRDRVTTIPPLL